MADKDPSSGYSGYSHTPGYNTSGYLGYQPASSNVPGLSTYREEKLTGAPHFRWWIPGDDISREVIQTDIQRYLGPDALIKPGTGTGVNNGRPGFWIAAYRNLTQAMLMDLKSDTANFTATGARGKYAESQIHQSRQYWGPSFTSEGDIGQKKKASPSLPTRQSYAPIAPAGTTSSEGNKLASTLYTYGAISSLDSQYAQTSHEEPRSRSYAHRDTQPPKVPPGYYLASDGNYYPFSAWTSRPSTPPPQKIDNLQPPASVFHDPLSLDSSFLPFGTSSLSLELGVALGSTDSLPVLSTTTFSNKNPIFDPALLLTDDLDKDFAASSKAKEYCGSDQLSTKRDEFPELKWSDTEASRSWMFQEEVIAESKAKLRSTRERLYRTGREIAQRCGLQQEQGFQDLVSPTQRGILGNGRYGIVEEVVMPSQEVKEIDTMVRKRFDIRGERRRITHVRKEIKVLKKLFHPHIVRLIRDYEEHAGSYGHKIFILMSPVGDNDLRAFLHNSIPYISKGIDPEYTKYCLQLRTWFQCLASALEYLHGQHIQHEDIKPSNIVYREGDVFVTDFGSSRELLLGDATSTESPALGTRLFAAPEALMDEDGNLGRHGYKTDVFSLGLVFAEMLWVLSGGELPLRQQLEEQSVNGAVVCQYHDVLDEINMILVNSDSAGIYLHCVKPMLNRERQERPAADAVLRSIVDAEFGISWRTLVCPCQTIDPQSSSKDVPHGHEEPNPESFSTDPV